MTFKQIIYRFTSFVTYMMVFAAIMYAVERTENKERLEKHVILQNLWMNMRGKYNMTRDEFDNVTRIIHQSQVSDKETWTYTTSVIFMFNLCTTIGYGHITPETQTGRLLTILIALFGIPLTLLTLNSIGTMVTDGCANTIYCIETRLLKRTSVQKMDVKCFAFVAILMILVLFAGAIISTTTTRWSLVESVYFWFITFSTVGFGDYVIRKESVVDNMDQWWKQSLRFVFLLYTVFGLSLLASAINCALKVTQGIKCSLTVPCYIPRVEGQPTSERTTSEQTQC